MPKPLDLFPAIRTRNADEMREALLGVYGVGSIDFPHGTEGFEGYANLAPLQHISLSYFSCGSPVRIQFPTEAVVRQKFALNGSDVTYTPGHRTETNSDQSCITPSGVEATIEMSKAYEQLTLRIPQATIDTKLAALLGNAPKTKIEFERAVDLTTSSARYFQRLLWFMVETLQDEATASRSAIIGELEQTIVLAFLRSSTHSFSHLIEKQSDAAPWQVRRAEEYIEANWQQPLTIEALADAVDTSVRSLFKTFAASRSYTPMEFLRSVRLKDAHAMLARPSDKTSVTAVGLTCGFVNLGHFSKHYAMKFGELPSETLGRARGSKPPSQEHQN